MRNRTTEDILKLIDQSMTPFHAVEQLKQMLLEHGFQELLETERWELQAGGRYFVTRNDSSILSFTMPLQKPERFRVIASHSDSPCFKLKVEPELVSEKAYVKLNTERYGGMINQSWLDRPLSIAGRVFVADEQGAIKPVLVNVDKDLLMIPSLAIHMDREVNKGRELNAQVDLLPVFAEAIEGADVKNLVRECVANSGNIKGDAILGGDLYVYNRQKATFWGSTDEFIASGRLDDLACAYSTMMGFLDTVKGKGCAGCEKGPDALKHTVMMHAVFDNEEVGSGTAQGADSTFLEETLERISLASGGDRQDYMMQIASSMMLSTDNAHAVHPNHAEKADPVNKPLMNRGIVIKFNANQKYTTDGYSAAVVRQLCDNNEIPYQTFTNRSDMAGGSTLGNISQAHVSMRTADIGMAQLAMHSAYESAGADDPMYMQALARAFYTDCKHH